MDMERIREIALKANPTVDIDGFEDGSARFLLMFAEGLVRECAEIAFNQWVDNGHEESPRPTILRHFGLS